MKKILWILYQPYKWIIFLPLLIVSTAVLGSAAVIFTYIVGQKKASIIGGVSWARLNSYLAPMFVKVVGRENLDKKQSYVIASNHQSHFDILLVYGFLGIDIKWVMKLELRKVPVLGFACEKLGHIYVNRSNHGAAIESLKAAKKILQNGTSMMIFPEGRRSMDGKLGVFKKGAFRTALEFDLPILPVTISGTYKILPTKSLNLFPGKAKMIIHKPIDVNDYKNKVPALMEKVKQVIQSGLEDG